MKSLKGFITSAPKFGANLLFHRRTLLMVAGGLVCIYALSVLFYVQFIPDLGLKSAFDNSIKGEPRGVWVKTGDPAPRQGDYVLKAGNKDIKSWPDLLKAPQHLEHDLDRRTDLPTIHPDKIQETIDRVTATPDQPPSQWAFRVEDGAHDYYLVYTVFEKNGTGEFMQGWCQLDNLPATELFPAILWFLLKLLLFVVGVLVLWKRPNDPASVQFFILCLVTLGAYIGGYHWPHISTVRELLIGFMICAVILPAVTLHFYLVFPRPKGFVLRHKWATWLGLYGLPLIFLGIIIYQYWVLRSLFQDGAPPQELKQAGDLLVNIVYVYLGVAAFWYLLSIIALLHSFWHAANVTERNQVKTILVGAVLALFPIGYTLYLAGFDKDNFGSGGATWPMFAASVCITAAFIVSITRYRLMELDQIISSSAVYFLISFLVGLTYYGVVFLGTLLFNQVLAGPPLAEALRVSTIALFLLLLMDLARSRFKKALDRRFHREKYHLDRTLQRMSEAVQQLVDPPTLVQRLLYASADLLGVMRGGVYLRQSDPVKYRLAGWVGPAPAHVDLQPGPLTDMLGQNGLVTLGWRVGQTNIQAQEQLRQLGGEVAHALVQDGRLLAFLVLGPKFNGPYRQEDLNLLAAFAQITVLALGSAEGHKTIEVLNLDLQDKVDKIAEQQRRIFALQSQLRRQNVGKLPFRSAMSGPALDEVLVAKTAANDQGPGAGEEATDDLEKDPPFCGKIVGSGLRLRQLLGMVRKVSRTDSVVLIRGESGTGKELLAEAVHLTSARTGKAFVKVHCAALSPTLLESELFGHVKGAFTGAHRDKVGRFELANGGTLFLDEIGDISLEVQTKLLRVLQEKTIERVGSSEPVKVDVRIIAATHQNLEELIRQGRFREDLYYRLNVFPIYVPPLRQRPEDIPELVMHFLEEAAPRCGKPSLSIDDDALALLKSFPWPGNIRQLENVIERAVVLVEGTTITVRDLPEELRRSAERDSHGTQSWEEFFATDDMDHGELPLARSERERFEREQLLHALQSAGGNKAQAARNLGIARSTFLSRLKKLGIG